MSNNFVLRKRGTNDCITSDSQNNVVLRDCDESISQRPNYTIFRTDTLKADGTPGNLQTIMPNPNNKNTNRDTYNGTLPYDQFISDNLNDVLTIETNNSGANFKYKPKRKNDPAQVIFKNNQLLVNNAGSPAKIGDSNVISQKFSGNKYSKDIVNTVNSQLAKTPAAIGVTNSSKWKTFLDDAIFNNPVTKYISNVLAKINNKDYTYQYPTDLITFYYPIIRTTNEEYKAIFSKLYQYELYTNPYKYGNQYIIVAHPDDVFPQLKQFKYDYTKEYYILVALVDTQPDISKEKTFLQGLYYIQEYTPNWLNSNKPAFKLSRPFIASPNTADTPLMLNGIFIKIKDGQFADKIYRYYSLNNIILSEEVTTFKVTEAPNDIYNYQDDPEIGKLYDRDAPTPIYNFIDPYTGSLAKVPNPAPNESHPYYSKCEYDKKYCFTPCYGRPDTQCATENPILIADININYFAKYYPDLKKFDSRGYQFDNRNMPTIGLRYYPYNENWYKYASKRDPLSDLKFAYDLDKTTQDRKYQNLLYSVLYDMADNVRKFRDFIIPKDIVSADSYLQLDSKCLHNCWINYMLVKYENKIVSYSGDYSVSFNDWTWPSLGNYWVFNGIKFNTSNGSVSQYDTTKLPILFPVFYSYLLLINEVSASLNIYFTGVPNNMPMDFYDVKKVFDIFEKIKVLTNNLNAEFVAYRNKMPAYIVDTKLFQKTYPLVMINGTTPAFRPTYGGEYIYLNNLIGQLSNGRSTTDVAYYNNYMNTFDKNVLNSTFSNNTPFTTRNLPSFDTEFAS